MMDRVGIHWFRLDLRLNDNPALYQLSKEVDTIIPIYIYEENIQIGEASKCWLEKSLESLDNELSKLDSKLYVFKGDPKKIIHKIIEDNNILCFTWNRLYDKHSVKRDKEIKSFLNKKVSDKNLLNTNHRHQDCFLILQ